MGDRINVTITGVEEAIANLKKYSLIKRQACKDILKEEGFKIEAQAKATTPVDTGRLRASISTNWSGSGKNRGKVSGQAGADDGIGQPGGEAGLVVVVGTNVHYGPHVEFGTTRMPERPFLTPAYLSHEGEVEKRLAAVLKEDVK